MILLHLLMDRIVAENSSHCWMARVSMAYGLRVVGAELKQIRSRVDEGKCRGGT
jgi:hypothetical protein